MLRCFGFCRSLLICAAVPCSLPFNGNQGSLKPPSEQQILTHAGSSLLRVVAQRSRVWGESSSWLHSSGTAVSVGPLPSSQIYKATCKIAEIIKHIKAGSFLSLIAIMNLASGILTTLLCCYGHDRTAGQQEVR